MSIESVSCEGFETLSTYGESIDERAEPTFEKSIFAPRSGLPQMRRSVKLAPLSPRELRIQQAAGRALDVNTSVEAKVELSWDGQGNRDWSVKLEGRVDNDRGSSAGVNINRDSDGKTGVSLDAKYEDSFN